MNYFRGNNIIDYHGGLFNLDAKYLRNRTKECKKGALRNLGFEYGQKNTSRRGNRASEKTII